MSWLGAWLVAVGVMDLARVILPRPARREVPLVGAVTLLGIALLGGLYGVADVIALVISLVPLAGWWWFADRSLALPDLAPLLWRSFSSAVVASG